MSLVGNKWGLGSVDARQNYSKMACGSGASLNLHLQDVQTSPHIASKQIKMQVLLALLMKQTY